MLKHGLDHELIAEFGVDHQVVEGAVGPLGVEIVADEGGALAVNFTDELQRFLFGFADRFEAADFFVNRGVGEEVEGVATAAKKIGGAAAHDDALAARSDILDDVVKSGDHAIGVEGGALGDGKRAFVTAAGVHLEQAIEQIVDALVTALRGALVDAGDRGDFGGEVAVPKLPTETVGQQLRDGRAATAIFALDGDDPDGHGCPRAAVLADELGPFARPKLAIRPKPQ